jgi:uncharacterized membrane protein
MRTSRPCRASLARDDWRRLLLLLLAGVGLAVSVYLTVVHYSNAPLACVNSGVVNCDLVTRSSYGVVPGTSIPVSLGGIVWFGAVLAIALAMPRIPPMAAASVLIGSSAVGAVVVLYLVYVELVRLHHICEWCTVVHAAVIGILLVSVTVGQDALEEADAA